MKKILKAEKFVNSLIKRQSIVGDDPNSFEPDLIKKEIQNEESLEKWKVRGKEIAVKKSIETDEDSSPLMNRLEDKYFLKASKLNQVIAKLKENLKLGDIDTDTRYSVNRTIYLDNRDLDSFQDNMMGVKPRFKVRIRQYNPNGEGWEAVAYIELKIKDESGLSRKIRIRIPASIIESISNGEVIESNEKLVNLNRDLPKTTLWKRIASINSIILKSGFKKQLVVEYNRRAYSGDDIRITIDDSLKYHSFRPIEKDVLGYITHSDHWKKSTKSTRELMSNDLLIMEVKHPGEIPKWVKNILKESKAEEARFSKYCAAIASFIMSGEKTEGRVQQQKKIGAYEVLNILDGKSEITKSENDLVKGMNGDWKKEGYSISHSYSIQPHPSTGEKENILTITASHPKYGKVGAAHFYVGNPGNPKDNNLYTKDLAVNSDHKRKGLATAMYQHGEGLHGRIIHDDQQSPEAKALWSQPNRMFGNDTPIQHAVKMKKSDSFQINISIPEDEDSLDKSEFYTPSQEGEEHPTKPYVAVRHPEGQLMWHHNKEMSQKNDSIINDPQMRQRLLSRMPSPTHKAGMSAIMDMVAKDPQRHFIPSRDAGKEKMRARHIKSLILSPEQSKIDLDANNVLSISMPRHGTMGGSTTWNYNLKPKKVVKSEKNELGNAEQGRDFKIDERVFSGRDLRKHERGGKGVEKTQHSGKLSDTGGGLGSLSGKHLKRLDIMKGAARRLYGKFDARKELGSDGASENKNWLGGNTGNTYEGNSIVKDPRADLPNPSPGAKLRMMNKLSNRAKSRINPQNGAREFLLHRQMSEWEHNKYKKDNIINHPSTHSSWTSNLSSITDSGGIYSRDTFDPAEGGGKSYNHIVSAWVPETHVKSFIPQYGKAAVSDKNGPVEGTQSKEQEVIVSPGHNSQVQAVYKDSGKNNQKWDWGRINTEIPKAEKITPIEHAVGIKKNEIIMKGAMNRLAPFRPEKTVTPEAHKATENWTAEGDDQSARSNVPEMHANAKTRALHKLGGLTQVRKHPKTGERMFLLHRGMGENEYRQNHIGSVSEYAPGTITSWTPKYSVASDFANDHLEGKKPRIASAWIPESEIHNVPNAMTVPDEDSQFRHEHEVMVNHMTPHPHANQDLVLKAKNPRMVLDNKINMKGQAEKAKNAPFEADKEINNQIKRSKRAEQFKRERFGKSELETANVLTKADISSKIKQGVAGIAMAAATLAPANLSNSQPQADRQPQMVQAKKMVNPNKQRILDSIADVESSGGKNTDHVPLPAAGIHHGESAYGKFGLMPLTIRETAKANPNLFKKHAGLSKLMGEDLHAYMDKNPGLENQIAQTHYDRLAKHFGHNADKIAMAWNNGITGTNRAIKQGMNIKKHPYVQKVLEHYNQRIKNIK